MIFGFRPHPPASAGPSALLSRDRPIFDLRVHGPAGVRKVPVLVDTGADYVILPANLMRPLGLDPARARNANTRGIGGRVTTYFFPVELEILVAADDRLRWAATVGFGPTAAGLGLFGVAGGLEFLHLTMSVIDGWFALAPHPLIRPLPPTSYPHQPLAAP